MDQSIKDIFKSKKTGSSHIEQQDENKEIKEGFLKKQERRTGKRIMIYLNKERITKLESLLNEINEDEKTIQDVIYYLIDSKIK